MRSYIWSDSATFGILQVFGRAALYHDLPDELESHSDTRFDEIVQNEIGRTDSKWDVE